MPTLRPFRDYDEKDVINLYTISGTTLPCNKGTLVKVVAPGFTLDNPDAVEMLGNMGDFSPSNIVAQRYGSIPKMTPITAASDTVLGFTLFDMRETDENGIPLKYNPRKAAEMEACISGQSVPVVTKGLFAYSGITTGNNLTGTVTAGTKLYASANAVLTTRPFEASQTTGVSGGVPIFVSVSGRPIALALGNSDAHAVTVIRFDAGGLY